MGERICERDFHLAHYNDFTGAVMKKVLKTGEPLYAEFRTRVNTKTTQVRFGLEWNEEEHPSFSILTRVVFVLISSGGFKKADLFSLGNRLFYLSFL